MLIKNANKRTFTQVAMLRYNLQAIWVTVNLKSRAHFWRHNRILKAMILHLRSSGLVLHSVWVSSLLTPFPGYPTFHGDRLGALRIGVRSFGVISCKISR